MPTLCISCHSFGFGIIGHCVVRCGESAPLEHGSFPHANWLLCAVLSDALPFDLPCDVLAGSLAVEEASHPLEDKRNAEELKQF